jgi:hypothetical protein
MTRHEATKPNEKAGIIYMSVSDLRKTGSETYHEERLYKNEKKGQKERGRTRVTWQTKREREAKGWTGKQREVKGSKKINKARARERAREATRDLRARTKMK